MTNSQPTTHLETHTFKDSTSVWLWLMSRSSSLPVAKFPVNGGDASLTDEELLTELQKLFEFAYERGEEAGYKKKATEIKELLNL